VSLFLRVLIAEAAFVGTEKRPVYAIWESLEVHFAMSFLGITLISLACEFNYHVTTPPLSLAAPN
jgi:hypothetical protein